MGTTEYLLIALLVIAAASLVIGCILLFRKTEDKEGKNEISRLNAEIAARIGDMKDNVTQSIYTSMMTFNEQVNQKLFDSSQLSGQNISKFQLSVNDRLGEFREGITARLNDNFKVLSEAIDKRMDMINGKVEDRLSKGFDDTNKTFLQIAERVKIIDDAQKNIQGLSKEMIGLQQILTNNQTRGSFGEYQLNQLLYGAFGEHDALYEVQYTIKEAKGKSESVRADAVIKLPGPDKLVAIDSKFPFSEYSKLFDNKDLSKAEEEKTIQAFAADIKKHITDIAGKYIIPGTTVDYALMFVASDGILALIHAKMPAVLEYAQTKRIVIVSPTTLYPLLSTYHAISLDYQRSKYADEINRQIIALTKEFERFELDWNKLNENIQKLTKQSVDVNLHVEKITTKFGQIKNVDLLRGEEDKELDSETVND